MTINPPPTTVRIMRQSRDLAYDRPPRPPVEKNRHGYRGLILTIIILVAMLAYAVRTGLTINDERFEDGSHIVTISYCETFGICQK